MAKKQIGRRILALVLTMVMCFGMFQTVVHAAPNDRRSWDYNFYLCQEYLGNAPGDPVKPDPVGYGFQSAFSYITFTDDNGREWTFNWNTSDKGDWKASGQNVSEAEAQFPAVTDGKVYYGSCGGTGYAFTITTGDIEASWTWVDEGRRVANWCAYIRFFRGYTVNVYYQNETGSVVYAGETFAAGEVVEDSFYFLYPNNNIISDSEHEDEDYTDPITLQPENFLPESMKALGYEIKYATDAAGNDVLSSGVQISLLGQNELNVYCTLKPPATENYTVVHNYYVDGAFEGSQDGGSIEVAQGSEFDDVVAGITKLPGYNGRIYSYVGYDVDPGSRVITLSYTRARPTYGYAVTYNANYGQNPATADDSENVSAIYDETYTITADVCTFERAYYTFAGWNTEADGSGIDYAAGSGIPLTAADNTETLYAQWQQNPKYDYIVTYNADFGQVPETAADEENVNQTYSTSYTIEVDENMFTRPNHEFVGWATESGGDKVYDPGMEISFINGGQKELFAVWKEDPRYAYVLTYDGNGGFAGTLDRYDDQESVIGTYAVEYEIGVNENTFALENYTFVGWNTEADGSGTAYAPGGVVELTAASNTEVLYAQWEENPRYDYALTYNANFGRSPETREDSENVTGIYAAAYQIGVDENTFDRENYTFVGWNTKADGSGKLYQPGSLFDLTAAYSTGVLYAQWNENPKYDYEVTYNANYGQNPDTAEDRENVSQTYAETYTINVDGNSFNRRNYDFVGWATEPDGDVRYLVDDVISFERGGSEELFAIWKEHDKYSYTVVYNGNGGELADGEKAYGDAENVVDVYDVTYGIEVDENTFVRENYTFHGWNSEADGSGIRYTAEELLTLDADNNAKVLYAQWEENPKYDYIVTYNANFGENPPAAEDAENVLGTYEAFRDIYVDANPFVRENYEFVGWAVEADGETVYAPGAKLSFTGGGSRELFAVWKLAEYAYTVEYLVRVDDAPYELWTGEVPAGGVLPYGTLVGSDIVNPPAQLADSEYVYAFVEIAETVIGAGENVVRVYYQYSSAPVVIPEEPVPTAGGPQTPAYDPAPAAADEPEAPVYEPAPADTVDGDGLVELPDEDVPLASAPRTGDPMVLYAGLTALSGAGLAWLSFGKKKEEDEE